MASMRTNPRQLITLLLVLELVMVAHGQTRSSTICNHSGVDLISNGVLLPNGLCVIIQVLNALTIAVGTGPASNPTIAYPRDVTLANILSYRDCLVVIVLGVAPDSTLTNVLDLLGILCILVPTGPDHNSLTGQEFAKLTGSLTHHEYASLKGVAGM